jgi:hypothetical protein
MNRFCRMASRFSGCLAVALLVLASLAVPTRFAFADSGFCDGFCSAFFTPGTDEYNACVSNCQSCENQCSSYTDGSTDWQNCMDGCASTYGFVIGTSCPNPTTNLCFVNNNTNADTCGGIGCGNTTVSCWCVYDSNNNCNCPP